MPLSQALPRERGLVLRNLADFQTEIARVRRAKALASVAFQVILPDWFAPTFDEIVAFLDTMAAETAPVPLVVYNPPHAKRRLTPPEWAQLVNRVPGLVGLKVPGGDEAWFAAMQPLFARISVFIPGHTLATGLARGAHGAYSNVACLSPAGAQRWCELCRTDAAAGLVLERKIQAFWFAHVAPLISELKLPNMAADKAAAVAGGWLPGLHLRLRWPYCSASPEQCLTLRHAAESALPEFFPAAG